MRAVFFALASAVDSNLMNSICMCQPGCNCAIPYDDSGRSFTVRIGVRTTHGNTFGRSGRPYSFKYG